MELSREVSKAKDKSKAKRVRGIKSISFSGFLVYIVLPLIPLLVGKELIQGFLFAPWITPMVAMSIVWSWMFRPDIGLINRGLAIFGISGPNWLTDSNTALIAVMIVTVWKTSGWCMLYY